MSLPILILIGVGGWLLVQWSYALGDGAAVRALGITIFVIVVFLALWTVGRRMKETGSFVLWLVGISVGGRLAQAGVRLAGGSRDQTEAALGLVIVLALLGLGFAPAQREPIPDEHADEDAEAEASL
jgi:hypothetical protein